MRDPSEACDCGNEGRLLRATVHEIRERDLNGAFIPVVRWNIISAFFSLLIIRRRKCFGLKIYESVIFFSFVALLSTGKKNIPFSCSKIVNRRSNPC